MKRDGSHIPPGFAVVWVRPVRDLATTSAVLGRALGGLTFEPADPGMFDEFPAQVAYSTDMRFALLAPPEDEDPRIGYQLYVEPLADADYESGANISDVLISQISAQTDLVCWEVE